MQTADLTGADLDAWVARAEKIDIVLWANEGPPEDAVVVLPFKKGEYPSHYQPSSNWSKGGPLIEKFGIGVVKFYEPADGPILSGMEWVALTLDDKYRQDGPTPLIAAMRALVASVYGDTVPVEVPA